MDENRVDEFEIKDPKAVIAAWIILNIFIFAGFAANLICYLCVDSWSLLPFIIFLIISVIFITICVFGWFAYFNEKFIFKDEVFTHINLFGKSQSIAVKDIAEMQVRVFRQKEYLLVDKNGNIVITIPEFYAWCNGAKFLKAIKQRQIQIKYILKR